eukprot:UC1_evm2s828
MGFTNPLPTSLAGECKKAAKIIREFTMPGKSEGVDKFIPPGLFAKCQGICVMTVVRAGFLVTARTGTGIVVAKTDDGGWSAPSAIGMGGIGGGFHIGGEVTDFVIILNTKRAVTAFSKGGNVTLGGNMSVAAGPRGRSAEIDTAARSLSAVFTYSKSRGLFVGISLEGSVIIERKGANRKLYGSEIRARDLLSGSTPQPPEADCVYAALSEAASTNGALKSMAAGFASDDLKALDSSGGGGGGGSRFSKLKDSMPSAPSFSRPSFGSSSSRSKSRQSRNSRGYSGGGGSQDRYGWNSVSSGYTSAPTTTTSSSSSSSSSASTKQKAKPRPARPVANGNRSSKVSTATTPSFTPAAASASAPAPAPVSDDPWDREDAVEAVFDFNGEMACDLSFKAGDRILVEQRTSSTDDWWEGRIGSKVGIFPANFCKPC